MRMSLTLVTAAATVLGLGALAGFAPRSSSESTAPAAALAKPQTFEVDGGHSSVTYRINHAGVANFYGRFNDISGSVMWDSGTPDLNSFNVTIAADSIDSNSKDRDTHLKSPDFFNSKQFPSITFASKSIKANGSAFELAGDLTLLGKTKPVKAALTLTGEKDIGGRMGYRAGWEATFTIKRSDFGMTYGIDQGMLGDEVAVTVAIEGVRK